MVPGLAAQVRYDLQPVQSENRMSENATRDMLEDRNGFIWIATIDGLNRYDGYRFRAYRYRADDSTGISDNYISALYEDRAGRLWIGSYHGLNRYDPACDCFKNFLDGYARNGAPGTIITDITESIDGRLWVGSYNGLSFRPPGSTTFHPLLVTARGLREVAVTTLTAAEGGGVWIGYAERGISRLNGNRWTHHFTAADMGEVKGIHELADGKLLIAARNGAYLGDTRTGNLQQLRKGHYAGIELVGERILMRSYFDGVFEWLPERQVLVKALLQYRSKPVDGDVHVYFQDRKGTVWGAFQGLVKQDRYEQRFHRISPRGRGDNGLLPSPEVIGIRGDGKGRLVVATQYTGLVVLEGFPGSWQATHHHPDALREAVLWSLPYVHGQTAWIAGIDELYRYDLATRTVERHPEGDNIKRIFRDSRGRDWYVDKSRGVGRFTGHFPLLPAYDDFGDDIPSDIQEDAKGGIWVLASEYVYRYDETYDRFERIAQVTPPVRRDLNHRYFVVGRCGDVWVATIDALYRYRFATDTFVAYTETDGLANAKVSTLLETDRGLWVGTNAGLTHFDYATESFKNYDTNDGLINTIHLPRSAYRDPDGYLYFGGINGIDYFHPDSIAGTDPFAPRAHLERIVLHSASDTDPAEFRWPQPDRQSPIRISHRSLPLQFDLLALGFTQARENRYAFIMEGVDDEWNYIGQNRSTIYSNLPRGQELTFRIKAASHDGVWSEPQAYIIYVVPPFWETTWFRMLLLALGTVALVAGYRLRIRQIRRHNQFLEAEVDRKTKQVAQQAERLVEVNSNLRQQAALIQSKARQLNRLNVAQSGLFTNLSHEFRTLLTLMLGYLDELREAEDPATALPPLMEHMRLNAGEMLRLVDQLMDTARLESGQYPLYIMPGNLRDECRNVMHAFHILADKSGINLHTEVNECVPDTLWFDRDVLYKVLSNLLSNALKFTPRGGSVHLALTFDENRIRMVVRDTGRGIPSAELPRIFDRFHQVRQADGNLNGTGIGLALVRKLVQRHRGTIEVESELGRGTSFTVQMPGTPSAYPSDDIQPARPLPVRTGLSATSIKPSNATVPERPKQNRQVADYQILIVEDNVEALGLLSRQLEGSYRVATAPNGREGLRKALEIVPDLIVTDRLMPKMDGLSLCRAVRSDKRISHIPVIMLTAMTTQREKVEGLGSGADLYLHKPFDRREFALVVEKQFEVRERMRKRFLQNISSDHLPAELNAGDQEFVQQLTRYVETHLSSDIDLTALSRELGLSRTQLFRKLKAVVGMSITEYIRDYRLRRAFELLQDPDCRIGEVIVATGFNSRSYFYRTFRAKFGFRPGEVKNTDTVS